MNIFADGLSVLGGQVWTIFSIFITVIWGQIIIIALFNKTFKGKLSSSEIISLGMAGWILPAFFLSMLLFVGAFLFGKIATISILSLAVVAVIFLLFAGRLGQISLPTASLFIGALIVFFILQVAFLKNMLLPSYFDSAEHYRIIKYLSEYYISSRISFPSPNYYHIGFHVISTTVVDVFHLGIVDIQSQMQSIQE